MQVFELDCIGTHLQLIVDTSSSCDEDFSHIRSYILDFESRYSRFVADNWLNILNKQRIWSLPKDAKNMIEYAIEVAKNTNGYFDPTIGKRLTELGYGNKNIVTISSNSENKKWFGDYRDIEIVWDELKLHGDIELEFGGVGKWYLIDIIKYILDKYPRFLINFGGDLYGRGNWEVGLESPSHRSTYWSLRYRSSCNLHRMTFMNDSWYLCNSTLCDAMEYCLWDFSENIRNLWSYRMKRWKYIPKRGKPSGVVWVVY